MQPCLNSKPVHSLAALFLLWAGSCQAQTPDTVDRLTQQWLATEHQTSALMSEWQLQQPILEQRQALLQAEKEQLLAILKQSDAGQSSVDTRRSELLAEQSNLEKQQQQLTHYLEQLVARQHSLTELLPPPLASAWQKESATLSESPEASQLLQVALAQLGQLADFDNRLSVHEAPIQQADGGELLVKQLYLGVGMAWFSSADGEFAGWGQASDAGWEWHIDTSANAKEIHKAIAIYEKRQQADLVKLPIQLTSSNAQTPLHNVEAQ